MERDSEPGVRRYSKELIDFGPIFGIEVDMTLEPFQVTNENDTVKLGASYRDFPDEDLKVRFSGVRKTSEP